MERRKSQLVGVIALALILLLLASIRFYLKLG